MKHTLLALGLGLFALSPSVASAQSAAASQAGLDAWNSELQGIYSKLLPGLKAELDTQARAQLTTLAHRAKWVEASVDQVRSIRVGIDTAPGLKQLTTQQVEVRVPRQGTWELEVDVVVKVRVKLIFTWATVRLPIRLIVDRLAITARAGFDSTDPSRPVLSRIDPPSVDFRVRLRSSNFLFDVLLRLLSPIGNWFAHKAARDALAQLQPSLAALSGQLPGPIPGDGAPLLTDSGRAVPLGEIARNVDRKIRRDHLPYGTLLMARMDVPANDSWEDAYKNGGPGNPGTASVDGDGGDSAIFTGMYLASQALRYAKTGESEALDNVGWVLQGVGDLLDVNGGTGLLARVTAPEATTFGQRIANDPSVYGRTTIRGQTWVGLQGGGGISRDQYIGVWFGLIMTYDLVPVPGVKAECSRRIQQMLDYFIAHDWYIDEDRRPFNATTGGGFPTFWFGVSSQKLLYLLMGTRLDPAKYGAEFQRAAPLTETNWLGAWTGVMNIQSYYKFNLGHLTNYAYFRLETDPGRWQDMARGFNITRRYTAHHMNPHFNLVQASVDPSLAATYHPAAHEALRRFATRNHRKVAPPVVDLSGVTYVTLPQPNVTLPGQNPQPTTITLPSAPLDIPLRAPTGDFMWQRDPFSAATPNQGDDKVEKNGLDLVLPYWMGHYHGAF